MTWKESMMSGNAWFVDRFIPVCGTALVAATACAGTAPPAAGPAPTTPAAEQPALPPIPAREAPLVLDLVYPPEGTAIAVRDSTFVFGSTGTGGAVLTINGIPVRVAPNGAFLGFLPVPPDGVYRLETRAGANVARLERAVEVPPPPESLVGARILAGSVQPAADVVVRPGEAVDFSFQGTGGGEAWLVLPSGERLPMFEESTAGAAPDAASDFQRTPTLARPAPTRQAAYRRSVAVAAPRNGVVPGAGQRSLGAVVIGIDTARAYVELVLGADTAREAVPASIAVLDTAVPRVGIVVPPAGAPPDWTVRGRHDTSGPFHYFWPPGTRLAVTGQRGGMLRVRLAEDRIAWVPAGDVRLFPPGVPAPASAIDGVRLAPASGWIDVRIPLDQRLPFHVEQQGSRLSLDVFGATSRVNFFQYGELDPLIEYAEWSQPSRDVFRVSLELTRPVWGYTTFFDAAGALVLRVRRPPRIDPSRPLRGLLIAVDAGHPPGGAIGPTRLTEAEANLAVARRLAALLEAEGARVLMPRTGPEPVDLASRPRMATDSSAHLLVSVHNNAFPDGVNPFENAGTSVYYYHPHSARLAALLQRELLLELRLRDIGIGRADLALARPTWMPAALTETMFLMVPEQESALRDPRVHDRIARAHLRALIAFVREAGDVPE